MSLFYEAQDLTPEELDARLTIQTETQPGSAIEYAAYTFVLREKACIDFQGLQTTVTAEAFLSRGDGRLEMTPVAETRGCVLVRRPCHQFYAVCDTHGGEVHDRNGKIGADL